MRDIGCVAIPVVLQKFLFSETLSSAERESAPCMQERVLAEDQRKGSSWRRSYYMPTQADRCAPAQYSAEVTLMVYSRGLALVSAADHSVSVRKQVTALRTLAY